jgi:hypothetical protein
MTSLASTPNSELVGEDAGAFNLSEQKLKVRVYITYLHLLIYIYIYLRIHTHSNTHTHTGLGHLHGSPRHCFRRAVFCVDQPFDRVWG